MFIFPPPAIASVAVADRSERFPVHRIYCVGRNYAEHALEMGAPVERGTPTFFMKPADAVWPQDAPVPYPPGTRELHHEVELVLALHSGGNAIAVDAALAHVFGYAVGLDLTRRDLQAAAKAKGNPWDTAKGFDASAPISAIAPASRIGHPSSGLLELAINGSVRQRADIASMIFNTAQIIAELSQLFTLAPGDLVFTGTPAGVGPLQRGDRFHARFADTIELRGSIG